MVYTKNLPIYRVTYTLVSLLIDHITDFPKLYKYSMGQTLLESSFKLFKFISMANNSGEDRKLRNTRLDQFLIEFEQIKTYLRLCREKHIITAKQMAQLSPLIASIGKQANLWKKS